MIKGESQAEESKMNQIKPENRIWFRKLCKDIADDYNRHVEKERSSDKAE